MAGDERTSAALERIFREEAGRLTATLTGLLGNFDVVEDLLSEAVVEALERWPQQGVPERATSWLLTTAKRKGLDRFRRDARYREKLALIRAIPAEPAREADDRLRLIFTCCHPVLSRESQIALTLRAVAGLTTAEIARGFLVSEQTVEKRIVRAKRKIVDSRVPFRVPVPEELGPRLRQVLTVIYMVFNEGYVTTSGPTPVRRDLARDAEWLATLLMQQMSDEPEVLGLVALTRLHLARWSARVDTDGRLVLLRDQDRSLWDRDAISDAGRLIARAGRQTAPGPFPIEAAIAAVHCEAESWEGTDWPQLLALYSLLARVDPSPLVLLNRAVALSHVEGPEAALIAIDSLSPRLSSYHLFHATKAEMLRQMGRQSEATVADIKAIGLTRNWAEQALIRQRAAGAIT